MLRKISLGEFSHVTHLVITQTAFWWFVNIFTAGSPLHNWLSRIWDNIPTSSNVNLFLFLALRNKETKTYQWNTIILLTSGGTRYYSEKFLIACLIWSKTMLLWFSMIHWCWICKICLDFFFCAVFLLWHFDITLLTILWWTTSIHIWAESNFFHTYRKKQILISDPNLTCFPVLPQSTSCFHLETFQVLILLLSCFHPNPHPVSLLDPSQPISYFYPDLGPDHNLASIPVPSPS